MNEASSENKCKLREPETAWTRSCHGREAVQFIQASSEALAEPWKHRSQEQGVLGLGFWHSPLPWCKCTCWAVMDSKVNSLRVLSSNMKLILCYGSDSGEEHKKVCAGLDPRMSTGERQVQVTGLWSFTRQLFWPAAVCGSGVTRNTPFYKHENEKEDELTYFNAAVSQNCWGWISVDHHPFSKSKWVCFLGLISE